MEDTSGDFMELQSLEVLKKQHQSGEAQVELVLQQLPVSGNTWLLHSLIQENNGLVETSPLQMQLLIF